MVGLGGEFVEGMMARAEVLESRELAESRPQRVGRSFALVISWSAGAVGLHALDAWVLQPEGRPTLTVRVMRLALLVLVGAVALLAWRVSSGGGRGVLALLLGSGALVAGSAITILHIRKIGLARSHYSGLASLLGGAALFLAGAGQLIRGIRSAWRRLLAIPVFFVVVLYVLFPVAVAVYATNSPRIPVGSRTPAQWGMEYEDVTIVTERGLRLSAWYVPSRNGAAVVLLHGSGSTRAATLDHGALLAGHGYGVLMVDAQGHGESEGTAMEWGWHGEEDVDAAVTYLLSRSDVTAGGVGVLGLSMGGQEAITAAAQDPRIGAVVSEGAIGQVFEDSLPLVGRLTIPFYRVMFTIGDFLSAASPPPALDDAVRAMGDRPLLLISGDEPMEARANEIYAGVGGEGTTLWTVPDTSHTQALRTQPGEYERRVISFFDSALSAD
jgi:uncharacterized protein